jgi:hypothetical protein
MERNDKTGAAVMSAMGGAGASAMSDERTKSKVASLGRAAALRKQAGEMLGTQQDTSKARLATGPSVHGDDRTLSEMHGTDRTLVEATHEVHDERRDDAIKRRQLHRAMEESTEGASPYAQPPPVAATGNDTPYLNKYFAPPDGASTYDEENGVAPGTRDMLKYGPTEPSEARMDDYSKAISMSDALAKREAYALGRAHQWEQGKTGKPVAWAHKTPDGDIKDDAGHQDVMSGPRGKVAKTEGKAAGRSYGRAVPPKNDEERALMAWRSQGKPEQEAEGPGIGYRALGAASTAGQGVIDYGNAVNDALPGGEQPMGPPPAAVAQRPLAGQTRAMVSDKRTKTKIDPMTNALADGLAPHQYEYKAGFAQSEGQAPGEKNVGIMAQNAEKNPITGVIVEHDEDGMRRINLKKSTSLALAAAGHNAQMLREQQAQIDNLKGRR